MKDKIEEYSIPPEVEAFLKESKMYNQEDPITETKLIEVSQNWEEFGVLNKTPKTSEKETLEKDTDTDVEENEITKRILEDLINEEEDKE